ncbi:MAG: IS91 family transposase [Lewinellaceae bacterium]|nr:IS91 family transposase [Phaeodactylibacter sp.]MCB9035953.1 IS91 family transposase [Lewinellaceae bacterium]
MALGACRTAALGAHKVACTECGQVQIAYNSCRNRNCPNCQGRQRQQWVQARAGELLPVPYFHLVFTLPDALNPLCLHNPEVMYRLLFEASWYTVNKLGKDLRWVGAQLGMVAILHTWGSNLSLHPHLHCMVPAGGLSGNGQWKHSKSKGKYLFNREVMGTIFRARYAKLLRKAIQAGAIPQGDIPPGLFRKLFAKPWAPYAEQPFRKARQVVNYIGRYSHSIAIGNHRIKNIREGRVTFSYKNYRKKGKMENLRLEQWEFIRRFAMHIIPYRFIRIRHYGILSNRCKGQALKAARAALGAEAPLKAEQPKAAFNPLLPMHYCSCCGRTTMHLLLEVLPPARAGPYARAAKDNS